MKINIHLITTRSLCAACFALLFIAHCAWSDTQNENAISIVEARQTVKERRAVFILIQKNFKHMVDMVKGKRVFNVEQLSIAARQMQSISALLPELFPPGSNPGKPQSDAKESVWKEHDVFLQDLQRYLEMTSQLADNATSMDKATLKTAVIKLGQECKQCHDEFRF